MESLSVPTYLLEKNKHERDDHIKFDEGPHIYHIDGDSGFTSVTRWCHSHFPKFDADAIIDKMMKSKRWEKNKYFGKTKKEIKDGWSQNGKEASEAGTKMHYDIECFYNNMDVENNSIEYSYFIKFYKKFSHLKPYRTEWMIYDKELRLAGSIDMIFENEKGNLEIYDWKRCKEIKDNNSWEWATTECIGHLPNSNYWHYSLQLNTYKAILEKKYGRKVDGLYLVCLHPWNSNKSFMRIKIPHLKEEMVNLFSLRQQEVNRKK